MKGLYDRIVWTVIALALSLIALNPWLGPKSSQAQSGVMEVDIVRVGGSRAIYVPVSIEQSRATLDVNVRNR